VSMQTIEQTLISVRVILWCSLSHLQGYAERTFCVLGQLVNQCS